MLLTPIQPMVKWPSNRLPSLAIFHPRGVLVGNLDSLLKLILLLSFVRHCIWITDGSFRDILLCGRVFLYGEESRPA